MAPNPTSESNTMANRKLCGLHLSSAPEETYLLELQLEQDGLAFSWRTVSSPETLQEALATFPSVLVADVPLPWLGAEQALDALQRTRPDLPVVFRWGGPGTWQAEDSASQVTRSIRSALALGFDRPHTPDERRAVLRQVVRYQSAHLELGRLDLKEWEKAQRRALEIIVDAAQIERASVWWMNSTREELKCEALLIRSTRTHSAGTVVSLPAAYQSAIERAAFMAVHDAVRDPRTSALAVDYLQPNGIASMLDAPIRLGGKVAGVLCLEHVGAPRHWNVMEQCAAAAFAGFMGRVWDARERSRLERQVETAQRLELVGRLTGSIAHDFSNLATVIAGFAESLLSECDKGDPRRDALEAIHEAGVSARSLVRQLLSFTATPMQGGVVDAAEAIRAARPMIRRVLGTATVVADLPEEPAWVPLDQPQFQRLLMNLACNARDAGCQVFQLVVTTASAEDDRPIVTIQARDDGSGIAPGDLPHVFDPLFTTKGAAGGTGLGLSSVHAVVTAAGGRVEVASQPARFTCFTIELPKTTAPPPAPTEDFHVTNSHGRRVLIVDDDRSVALLLHRILSGVGLDVSTATEPGQLADLGTGPGPSVDLLITDLNLQSDDGRVLIQRMRRTSPRLPVLVTSGRPDELESIDTTDGRTLVLAKPFSAREIISRVRKLLDVNDPVGSR